MLRKWTCTGSLVAGPEPHSSAMPPQKPVGVVFVTVGTTRFDALIAAMLEPGTLDALVGIGTSLLVLQHGHGPAPTDGDRARCRARGVTLECFAFEPNIAQRIRDAGLVVSHGGAGSLMEALALRRRVVAVVNRRLMHDHQSELAAALHAARHLVATDVGGLATALSTAVTAKFVPLPERDAGVLPAVLAQEAAWWT